MNVVFDQSIRSDGERVLELRVTQWVRSVVFEVLARHLDPADSTLHPWQHLEVDLDLTRLEIALIVAEIEVAMGVELDVEGLEHAQTVSDLVAAIASGVARARRRESDAEVA